MHRQTATLKSGEIVEGDFFDTNDVVTLIDIFRQIQGINATLKSLKGRAINVPDVVSEGLFAHYFNAIRTNDETAAGSYDCVSLTGGLGIQVKSSSIPDDLTSFGPKSTWDELYFMDFSSGVDAKVYKIPNSSVYNMVLNKKKNETFVDQQNQGRRPRFSIQESIIKPQGLKPIMVIPL